MYMKIAQYGSKYVNKTNTQITINIFYKKKI